MQVSIITEDEFYELLPEDELECKLWTARSGKYIHIRIYDINNYYLIKIADKKSNIMFFRCWPNLQEFWSKSIAPAIKTTIILSVHKYQEEQNLCK